MHSPWCILYMTGVTTKQSGRDEETAEKRSFLWRQTWWPQIRNCHLEGYKGLERALEIWLLKLYFLLGQMFYKAETKTNHN